MKGYLFLTVFLFGVFAHGNALQCKKEVFGISIPMNCPGPGDDSDEIYCCGFGDDKYCCKSPISLLDDDDVNWIIESIPKLIGILAAVVLTIIVLCIVCCCCCPFCLLAKRRNRGAVHQPNPEQAVMQPLQQPPPNAYPSQPAYPQQPQQAYPQQPYPPQGYPPQPYPPQGPPPGQPYPPQQPYPQAPPTGDQPPAYTEKPPSFNPNFQ